MSATGFTPISLYYTTTASAAPTAGNLVAGELAINTTDGKLYYKDTAGTVQLLSSKDATSGSFVNLAYTGTFTGGTGVVNLGSGQLYKDASGNVILGGTTQNGKLTLKNPSGSGEQVMFAIQSAASTSAVARITYNQTDDSLRFANMSSYAGASTRFGNNGLDQVIIDSGGNVGIGTSSPAALLEVKGTAPGVVVNGTSTTAFRGFSIRTNGNEIASMFAEPASGENRITAGFSGFGGYQTFYTNGLERCRIDTNGNLLVGTTSILYGSGQQGVSVLTTGGYALVTQPATNNYNSLSILNASGTLIGSVYGSSTATAYNTSSDYRLKENIAPMTGALARVSALKPVTYKWKVDGSDGEGFIAHELQAVVPDCVTGEKDAMRTEKYEISPAIPAEIDEDGKVIKEAVEAVIGEREVPAYQGIDTSFLVATLTAAIQELNAKVTTLEEQVLTLSVK
jgi:hypothetical protein